MTRTHRQRRPWGGIALAALLLPLAACTHIPDGATSSRTAPSSAQSPSPLAPQPPQAGYYLDDGPPPQHGDIALADIPDAQVKWERIKPATSRPYVVLGKRYVPFTALQPYRRRGVASWYGRRYHGRKTASGEVYDMFKMSAAHPILPIPSYVRVTRISSGKSIVVRINDRGPFLQGREIDLSYVAAAKLGIVDAGTGEVLVEAIIPSGTQPSNAAGGRVEDAVPSAAGVFIQLAAFAARAPAQAFAAELKDALPAEYHARISVHEKEEGLYAVQLGPYEDHDAATIADQRLCGEYERCGFLTKRY